MNVYFIGVGPGDPELITVKGRELLKRADTVIYPGSSINREILDHSNGELINSWNLSFDEVVSHIVEDVGRGKVVVKLHSGDPSLFEDSYRYIALLSDHGIDAEIIPGVSSLSAIAASSRIELAANQALIVVRPAGEPWRGDYRFESGLIEELSEYYVTMAIFIGTNQIREIMETVNYSADTEVLVVYHASWDDEEIIRGTVADIADKVEKIGITRSAAILIKSPIPLDQRS